MIATETSSTVPLPQAPSTLHEAGLSLDLATQLVLKTLHFAGELTGSELARRLCLAFPVLDPSIALLLAQHHLEIVGGAMLGRPSYRYRITDAGRSRAILFLESSQYVGEAPVPLEQYREYMQRFQASTPFHASRDSVRAALSHLVISDKVLDQLGPAISDGHSMFVYGPPGNGKTVISEAVGRMLAGEIAIPHALEVEGNIVRFFNPVNHEPLPPVQEKTSLDLAPLYDARWVRCKRPTVVVGGELRLESLDLSFNPTSGYYTAPIQAVANGGVLVIDDFGRQQCPPRDLLNRWIVPLESRVDFLTLRSGLKFEFPFMALVVFATNIRPVELVDEAFLRRIQYKIFAESPTIDQFTEIFERHCRQAAVPFERSVVERLLNEYYRPRKIELRGCQPRDLINHALSLADYLGEPRCLTYQLLEAACASYFVDDTEAPPVYV